VFVIDIQSWSRHTRSQRQWRRGQSSHTER